jgi:glucose-1-phosphate cytidylyltransferase
MKTIILAGGFGTRLSEYTDLIPKPMVQIGSKPILFHIMRHYANYGYKDFLLALGYKADVIKKYFLDLKTLNSNFTIDLTSGNINHHEIDKIDWSVTLIDTGENTMTGGRVRRMKQYINNETFFLTYGDGLSDINIDELIAYHKSHGKMVTVTAVHPSARFGELEIDDGKVLSFMEKPQTMQDWVNGGFFVCEPEFLDLISDDNTVLERAPLEIAAEQGQLMAYNHHGFWQCMDSKRDKDYLEEIWKSGHAPWRV